MFQTPVKTVSFVAPAEPIDTDQKYLVKVVDLVDMGVSNYAEPDDPNPVHRIRWIFRMATTDGVPILDVDGNAYEHFDYTSSKTTKGKTRTATARLWMEALLGPLEDDEIGVNIQERLKEKVAVGLFDKSESGGQDGAETYERLKIIRLSPFTKPKPVPVEQPAF